MEFSKLQLTSFIFVCLATIFLIVGVSTNYWIQTVDSEEVVQSSIGLWKSCTYDAKGSASCVSLGSIKNTGKLEVVYETIEDFEIATKQILCRIGVSSGSQFIPALKW